MFLRTLLWLFLGYFLFKFLFRFLIPLISAGYRFNRQLKKFREQVAQEQSDNPPTAASRPNYPKAPATEKDYIDFEEVKS